MNLPLPRPPAWICAFTIIDRPGELLCGRNMLFHGKSGHACRDADAEFRQQFLRLVFVNVHAFSVTSVSIARRASAQEQPGKSL